jgi:hypothetical protein
MENNLTKPPLGLMPIRIHQENRFDEVCAAITRYYNAGLKIPIEWIVEYNELIDIIIKYHSDKIEK